MPEDDSARLFAWLAAHGPDEWHQLASFWLYDRGLRPMAWIVMQPDCDRATAQRIFWDVSDGRYDLPGPNDGPYARECHALLSHVIARWRRGGFTRSELASSCGDTMDVLRERFLTLLAGVPSSFGDVIIGRTPRSIDWDGDLPAGIYGS
ncbi:hypothetical protein IP88_04890 [alpha proteobacterium AAP81b]|nr:hypothetical protein IP88_04890 [alpha proteobacterium AAP81b]